MPPSVTHQLPKVYASADRLASLAYPKARQLGTDLDRDFLRGHLPVRQVALDDVWSAMRFRPAT